MQWVRAGNESFPTFFRMTDLIQTLDAVAPLYRALYCDLWGCLHDGTRAYPQAVTALQTFRAAGGSVVLLTNSPRPGRDVARQIAELGAPSDCYDVIVSSGDAAQAAMATGQFGRRVFHIGPPRDEPFFHAADGTPIEVERVLMEDAEGVVCTGLFDDRTETPDDYRDILLQARTRGLKLLCANPDVVVDAGETRLYCAGALAQAYAAAGGEACYFGKPHPPIYALAREWLTVAAGTEPAANEILCIGDGIATDIAGAMRAGLDAMFVAGGLAAEETGTTAETGPDPSRLDAFLTDAGMKPRYAIGRLR